MKRVFGIIVIVLFLTAICMINSVYYTYYTTQILEILDEYGITATFFVIGVKYRSYGGIICVRKNFKINQ